MLVNYPLAIQPWKTTENHVAKISEIKTHVSGKLTFGYLDMHWICIANGFKHYKVVPSQLCLLVY